MYSHGFTLAGVTFGAGGGILAAGYNVVAYVVLGAAIIFAVVSLRQLFPKRRAVR